MSETQSNMNETIKKLVEQDTDKLLDSLKADVMNEIFEEQGCPTPQQATQVRRFNIGTGDYLVTYGEVTHPKYGPKPCLILRKYPEDGSELDEQAPLTDDDCGVAFIDIDELEAAIKRVEESYPQFPIKMNEQVIIVSRNVAGLEMLIQTLKDLMAYADQNIWNVEQ